jgi:nucleoside phosphorylase
VSRGLSSGAPLRRAYYLNRMSQPLEVLFAVAAEIEGAAVREALERRHAQTRIGVETLGVGPDSVERLREVLQRCRPQRIVSPGLAGSLDPLLRAGDVVVVTEWIDADAPERSRTSAGRTAASADLVAETTAALQAAGITVRQAPGVTVDAPLHDADRRRELHRAGAAVVEMEGRRWARLAADFGCEFLSVRVISDDAASRLPLPRHLLLERNGSVRWQRWLQAISDSGQWRHADKELRALFRARREWVQAMAALDAVGRALTNTV